MQSLRKPCSIAALTAMALYSGNALADWQLDMTPGVTDVSQQVFDMHRIMLGWCAAIGVVVFGAMFYSMLKHRKSKGHKASQFHESTAVEILWTVIPFIILIIMAVPATKALIAMSDTSDSALTIKVTGSQWKWHYEYLDYEGNSDINLDYLSVLSTPRDQIERPKYSWGLFPKAMAKDKFDPEGGYPEQGQNYNIEVDNPLVIPTGKKVRFLITSDDVIHAWWVPDFAIKKDAVPGFINELWTQLPEDQTGIYRGQCAELCGKDHAFMPIVVDARSPEEFEKWLASAQEAQAKAEKEAASSVNKTFTKEELMAKGEQDYLARCSACHQANGQGLPPTFPALANSPIALGDVQAHIDIVNNGKNAMPAFKGVLDPATIAAIITYERNAWGNVPSDGVDVVQPRDVVSE